MTATPAVQQLLDNLDQARRHLPAPGAWFTSGPDGITAVRRYEQAIEELAAAVISAAQPDENQALRVAADRLDAEATP